MTNYIFLTESGQLLSTEPFPNGNMLYATAQFQLLTGGISDNFKVGILDCEVLPGLYSRSPYDRPTIMPENTTIDDYLALACNRGLANDIYSYGMSCWGFFNVAPTFQPKQWLWRFVGFWQHVKLSSFRPLGWVGQLLWACSIYAAAKQPFTNQDGWIQSHLMVLVYQKRNACYAICDKAIQYWLKKKTVKTSEIMAAYIGDPEHPLVKAWQPYN